jgi:hypothetical protein
MSKEKSNGFAFGKENYIYLIAGVVLVCLGLLLMSGGGSEDPSKFNANELFSTRRITVAPILILGGYVVVLFGIMKKPKQESGE